MEVVFDSALIESAVTARIERDKNLNNEYHKLADEIYTLASELERAKAFGRYGSQQSLTRSWLMPMHTTDSLFHKSKTKMAFIFGGEADNHTVNTVPKETLVKITKAEDGGIGGIGVWAPARTGFSPGNENEFMKKYLSGKIVRVLK